jgi:hypothetical protein
VESDPVAVSGLISDTGQGRTVLAVNAVARRAGDVVAVYVGGEARRVGSVRIALACGPAIVRLARVSVEIQDEDGSVVEQLSTFQQVAIGRGGRALSADLAVVKGRTLRMTLPLEAMAHRRGPNQRLRVLVELRAEPFVPNRSPLVQALLARGEGIARQSYERLLPHAERLVKASGTERVARQLLNEMRKSGVARSITRR